jgi:hypothetical protein
VPSTSFSSSSSSSKQLPTEDEDENKDENDDEDEPLRSVFRTASERRAPARGLTRFNVRTGNELRHSPDKPDKAG